MLQNVYANMAGNVLVHVSAPSLGLAAAQWAVVSWGESQVMRESITDAKYIYRCAPVHTLHSKIRQLLQAHTMQIRRCIF